MKLVNIMVVDQYCPDANINIKITIFNDNLKTKQDILTAIKNACTEFCKTENGHKVYNDNNGIFNWGDFYSEVPDHICKKYGFKVYDEVYDYIFDVEHDEQLVDEATIDKYFTKQ